MPYISKEELEHLYLIKRLSMKQVGDLFNVSADCIFGKLKFYKIPYRTKSEALKGRKVTWGDKIGQSERNSKVKHKIKLSKNDLYYLYHILSLRVLEIANLCEVCPQTVYTAFHRMNIPIKYIVSLRKQNFNPEFIKKRFKGMHRRPTKPEIKLGELIEKVCPNEYKYVGDGEVTLGQFNPDFINVNGRKKIIEMFGTYWHRDDNSQHKIDEFAKYGFDTLVIWEHELKDEDKTIRKIKNFTIVENQMPGCIDTNIL